jgi:excisionase family DNA binding protein
MNTTDYLPVKEAAKHLPSHKPGKHINPATVYRWIFDGKLPAVKRGRYYFVRLADLQAMMVPTEKQEMPRITTIREERAQARAQREQDEWADRVLREAGFKLRNGS